MTQSSHKKIARMLSILSAFMLLFSLTACSSIVTQQDYDPSRNFANYHTWSWKQTPVIYSPDNSLNRSSLTTDRINDELLNELPAKGLMPAAKGARADVQIQVTVANVRQNIQVADSYYYGGPWGYGPGWGGPWGGPWGGGPWGPWGPWYGGVSTVEAHGILLQLDMFDGHDGQLIWRGRVSEAVDNPDNMQQRNQAIADLVQAVLAKYPPP